MNLSKQAALAVSGVFVACSVAVMPAAAQSAPVAEVRQPSSAYRINSGDELEIYVWGEERLQRMVRVLPDGTFAFPLVGQVVAQGKLPQELEKTISEQLREQYRGQVPQVTVSVKSPSGMQFSIMGRVRAPGTYTPGRYITILEALSFAGGPADFANLDNVLLIRKNGDRVTTMRYRLSSIFKSGAGDADVQQAKIQRIEPGDTIIVP